MATRAAAPIRVRREVTRRFLAELYVQAGAFVERHYRRPLALPAVARALSTSPRQLQRAYAEVGRTSFAAQLRGVRLRNAAELLAHQPLTVTDVARLVGYRQPSHFVKAFRRMYGVTPGAFRDATRRNAAIERVRPGPRDDADRPSPFASGAQSRGRSDRRLAATRLPAHRQARAARNYSNPNSRVVFGADDEDGGRDDDAADDAPPEDGRPALAACADDGDDCVEDVEPLDPEPASKPNSLLAGVADDATDPDPPAPFGVDDVVDDDRRTVCVIGAGARAAAADPDVRGFDDRCSATAAATWWRSRGSGPPKSPIWSQTT
jgi:AraC family transcriptional regulator, regulatory protein of adaptative response / methylphosphotriester-DNA alkyltransferase methyltransferase